MPQTVPKNECPGTSGLWNLIFSTYSVQTLAEETGGHARLVPGAETSAGWLVSCVDQIAVIQ